MLRRLAAVVASLFLIAATSTGSLYVTTLPSGADVWIDGTYVGRSPLVLDALPTGRHTVGVTKAGWASRQLDVPIVQAQTTFLSTRLDAEKNGVPAPPGAIRVHGTGLHATYVDGVALPATKDGSIPASAGSHEVVVRTQRGRVTRTVRVWPQTTTDVVLQEGVQPGRPSVVAPAADYLPTAAIQIAGDKVSVRYNGHVAVGHIGLTNYRVDGRAVDYDAGPTLIGTNLYLPLELLTLLSESR